MDIEHIAEEIEDLDKCKQHGLAHRMAVPLKHLLKWKYKNERQSASWKSVINTQRAYIQRRLRPTPSLIASLNDGE